MLEIEKEEMTMEKYEELEMEIIKFEISDIIEESGPYGPIQPA